MTLNSSDCIDCASRALDRCQEVRAYTHRRTHILIWVATQYPGERPPPLGALLSCLQFFRRLTPHTLLARRDIENLPFTRERESAGEREGSLFCAHQREATPRLVLKRPSVHALHRRFDDVQRHLDVVGIPRVQLTRLDGFSA